MFSKSEDNRTGLVSWGTRDDCADPVERMLNEACRTATEQMFELILAVVFHYPRGLARLCSLSRIIPLRSAAGRISKGPNRTPGCLDINSIA